MRARTRTRSAVVGVTGALATVATIGGVLLTPSATAAASTTALPTGALRSIGAVATGQSSSYVYQQWATADPVSSYKAPDGRLTVVRRSFTSAGSVVLIVQRYDARTLRPSGAASTVSIPGWTRWGGFYAGSDGYTYVLAGRPNTAQNDAYATVTVRRYDRSWRLVGAAYVKGGVAQGIKGIYEPFEAGSARMLLVAGRLVVHMSRTMYAISGVHHQADLTFEVNPARMTATMFSALGDAPYSSHSFAQFVTTQGSNLVLVDHGDAFPRAVQVSVLRGYPAKRSVANYRVFPFSGATGDNYTGTSITDTISGPGGVVILGNSTRSGRNAHRNLLLIHVDATTGRSSSRLLTAYAASGGSTVGEPRAVRVGTDRYAVLVDVTTAAGAHQLQYRLMSSAGTVLASRTFPGVTFTSISEPVLVGRSIVWVGVGGSGGYGTTSLPGYLYALNVGNPAAPVRGLAPAVRRVTSGDYTGDGRADPALYRPSTRQWFVRNGSTMTYGTGSDQFVPGDYTGDGRTDRAVYRPSTNTWYITGIGAIHYGIRGDRALPAADYNGDRRADLAVYRPSTRQWFVRGQGVVRYGIGSDRFLPADYNGDGRAERAVYRASTNTFYVLGRAALKYGVRGDRALPVADYNGDHRADLAVYRPATRQWFVRGQSVLTFGVHTDQFVPADYNGDGRADRAVYRPSTGRWYVYRVATLHWGSRGDRAIG